MPDRKWLPLAVVVLAIFMLLVDITIVNVALPDIERSLGTSFTELQWVIDAYGLALATIMLNAGALADRIGRRKVFLAGLAIFTRASLVCGFAGSPLFLIAARGVQGIGGAIMFATSPALVAQSYAGRDRGVAFGVRGATAGGERRLRQRPRPDLLDRRRLRRRRPRRRPRAQRRHRARRRAGARRGGRARRGGLVGAVAARRASRGRSG